MTHIKTAIAEIRKTAKSALLAQIGGFRPPDHLKSYFGGKFRTPRELWPTFKGTMGVPLMQIVTCELETVPVWAEGLAMVQVFIHPDELPTEELPAINGDHFRILEHGTIPDCDDWCPSEFERWPKPFPIKWHNVQEDYPVWEDLWNYVSEMLNLQFGEIVRDKEKSWGQYALHIQAPWRLVDGSNLLISSADHWNPVEAIVDWDQWYEDPHPSLEDQFWEMFIGGIDPVTNSFEGETPKVKVDSIQQKTIGDLKIEFDNGFQFQVFASGNDNEFWRLLNPGLNNEHYVVGTESD